MAKVSGLKHEEIARVLGGEIRDGGLAYGSQLPGETTLAERFAVSRNTVRAALNELARAGLISTRSGKGSYVTYDGRPLTVRLGWARALEAQGVPTRVRVLAADAVEEPALAAELGAASACERCRTSTHCWPVEATSPTPTSMSVNEPAASPRSTAAASGADAGTFDRSYEITCPLSSDRSRSIA